MPFDNDRYLWETASKARPDLFWGFLTVVRIVSKHSLDCFANARQSDSEHIYFPAKHLQLDPLFRLQIPQILGYQKCVYPCPPPGQTN